MSRLKLTGAAAGSLAALVSQTNKTQTQRGAIERTKGNVRGEADFTASILKTVVQSEVGVT